VGARFSALVQTYPGAHPDGYRLSFSGVKRPGRCVGHPPPCSADVKDRVELYLFSPSGSPWPVLGWYLPFTFNRDSLWTFSVIAAALMEVQVFRGLTLSLGMHLPTFRRMVMPSLLISQQSCLALTIKTLQSIKTRGTVYPTAKGNIPGDLDL
jgi:hypothetical protein